MTDEAGLKRYIFGEKVTIVMYIFYFTEQVMIVMLVVTTLGGGHRKSIYIRETSQNDPRFQEFGNLKRQDQFIQEALCSQYPRFPGIFSGFSNGEDSHFD